MQIFILAAAALICAAILWYKRASGTAEGPPQEADMDHSLCRTVSEDRMAETLTEAVLALETVMEHPEFGGPGFLLIQFPPESSFAVVTAQYPNIREALYRRIVRQELDREQLAAAGMPEAALSLGPSFETESGGVVLVSVQTGKVSPEFKESLHSRRERGIALGVLVEELAAKLPRLSIRIFGADLLLSPDREVISIDE